MDLMSATTKQTNQLIRELGNRIINSIDQASLVTPHALVATAFLNCPQNIVSYKTVLQHIDIYLKYLDSKKTALSDTLLINSKHAIEQAVTQYIQKGYIDRVDSKKEAIWSESRFQVVTGKRTGLDYYKNNAIFHFIPAAYTAAAILSQDAFLFASTDLYTRYRFLENLLQNEFSIDLDSAIENKVRRCIKAFIDDAMLIPHPTMPDTYNLTSVGFRKLQLFANFLKPFLESYLIVATVLQSTPRKKLDGKKRIKRTLATGNRMVKNKDVQRSEAANKNYFENALTYFSSQRIYGAESLDRLAPIKDKIQRLLEYLPD
jgi:glycerol-3-phosphate O-acyltransferase